MGNNLSGLGHFHSPPNPPTPLSPEKYFWIESSDGSERCIPAIYITNEGDSRGDTDAANVARTGSTIASVQSCGSSSTMDSTNSSASSSSAASDNSNCSSGSGIRGNGEDDRYTLLYCHGQDVDLGLVYNFLSTLSRLLNVDILSFDYEGYGISNESPSKGDDVRDCEEAEATETRQGVEDAKPTAEERCNLDILSCYAYLTEVRGVQPRNIVLYGKSLGSGPVCWLAERLCREHHKKWKDGLTESATKPGVRTSTPGPNAFRKKATAGNGLPLAGVVLHSAFLSLSRVHQQSQSVYRWGTSSATAASSEGGSSVQTSEMFDNVAALRSILSLPSSVSEKLPIYLMHGQADTVVPFAHGVGLYEVLMAGRKRGFPPFWADGGTHWNMEQKYAIAYIKRLQQFIRHCAKMKGQGVAGKNKKKCQKQKKVGAGTTQKKKKKNAKTKANVDSGKRPPHSASHDIDSSEMKQPHCASEMQSIPLYPARTQQNPDGTIIQITRPSFRIMPHHSICGVEGGSGSFRGSWDPHNSRAARQRKKKGTLVIRGDHEQNQRQIEHLPLKESRDPPSMCR